MDVQADLVIRSGYLALRRICDFFRIPYEAEPKPTDATSIDRARFDHAFDVLAEAGVPMVADREQAWRDFNGWRVNYDAPLRGLERLTMAPAPWWDRPMRSAYVTDEPMVAETADRATQRRMPPEAATPEASSSRGRGEEDEVRRDHERRDDDQRGDDAQDAHAPHPPVDRAERAVPSWWSS